jgi:hypothetical protein
MNYAIVTDSIVTNIISLQDSNANEFPNAVKLADRPVAIGDTYDGEKFYRDGVEVLTEVERLQVEIETYKAALNTVGVQTEVTENAE